MRDDPGGDQYERAERFGVTLVDTDESGFAHDRPRPPGDREKATFQHTNRARGRWTSQIVFASIQPRSE